jgi:hypothetical protein
LLRADPPAAPHGHGLRRAVRAAALRISAVREPTARVRIAWTYMSNNTINNSQLCYHRKSAKYRVSLKKKEIYDARMENQFCSEQCLKVSKSFSIQTDASGGLTTLF